MAPLLSSQYSIILLAAGASRRLGRPKQLLSLGNKPLLRHLTHIALSLSPAEVVVVLGAGKDQIRSVLEDLSVRILTNPNWERGMATSLQLAIQHVESNTPHVQFVLLLVCDQPHVTFEILEELILKQKESGKPLVASRYGETIGVPALIGKKYFRELKAVEGDRGARKVLRENPRDLAVIDFPQGEVDLDTEADLEAWREGL